MSTILDLDVEPTTRKERRRVRAILRDVDRASRSDKEQLARLDTYPGECKKERAKLLKRIKAKEKK